MKKRWECKSKLSLYSSGTINCKLEGSNKEPGRELEV